MFRGCSRTLKTPNSPPLSAAPLLISAVASGHLKLNKFYFGFFIGVIQHF